MTSRCDIVLAGVGGQGVLSLSSIIAFAAVREGMKGKQCEVHGMAQRGGAVMAQLRLSNEPVASDLIPKGGADIILSLEPLESLRYLAYLRKDGAVVTATNPLQNISDYPDMDTLLERIRKLPSAILVDAEKLAREAGFVKASNMVMVGAVSHLLPIRDETLEACIEELFGKKGQDVVDTNIRAFRMGRDASHDDAGMTRSA